MELQAELHLLKIYCFKVSDLRKRFVGTERGSYGSEASGSIEKTSIDTAFEASKELGLLALRSCHRYLHDMGNAFDTVKGKLEYNACLLVVAGTTSSWRKIRLGCFTSILEEKGFTLFALSDPIGDRLLAPTRAGHRGLIKEVSFCLSSWPDPPKKTAIVPTGAIARARLRDHELLAARVIRYLSPLDPTLR